MMWEELDLTCSAVDMSFQCTKIYGELLTKMYSSHRKNGQFCEQQKSGILFSCGFVPQD